MQPARDTVAASDVRRIDWLLVGGALAVGALDTIQFQLGSELRNDPNPIWLTIGGQFLPWCWLAALLPVVVRLTLRWPVDGDRWRGSILPHLGAMTVFSVVQIGGAILASGLFARGPVSYPLLATKLLLFRFPIDALAYWGAVAATHAARAASIGREREQVTAQLEASLAETRLASLRDRLNPHFVFNTLNAVTTLALREDHASVIRTVDALSDLLRRTLAEGRGQEASLREELAFLDRYLEIERLRLGDRVTFATTVDRHLLDAMVPVMLVQPLVENAVRHGAAVKPGPVQIAIEVKAEGDSLVIEVTDSGPGFGTPSTNNGSGIGLSNCRARLAALYGPQGRLDCGKSTIGGALVRVTLPRRPMAPA